MNKFVKVFEILEDLAKIIVGTNSGQFVFDGNFWYGYVGNQVRSWKIDDGVESINLDMINPIAQEMLRDFSKENPANWDDYDVEDIALFESQMKHSISELKEVFGDDFNFKE